LVIFNCWHKFYSISFIYDILDGRKAK